MQPRRLPMVTATLLGVLSFGFLGAFSGGPAAGFSGAPGDGDCTACHSDYPLNSQSGGVTITAPEYIGAATSIPITVSVTNTQVAPITLRNGFQLTVRSAPGASEAGLQATTPDLATSGPFHLGHSYLGVNQSTWSTTWSVPATLPGGPVKLYGAGNAANGDWFFTGDHIYTTSKTLYRVGLTGVSPSWSIGNVHPLIMDMPPGLPGHYVMLVTLDATPTPLGGPLILPVNAFDPFVNIAFSFPNYFHDLIGSFDAAGLPLTPPTVWIPPDPGVIGVNLNFAYVTFDQTFSAIVDLSNRFTVTLTP